MAGTAYNDESRQAQLYKFNGNEVLEGEGTPTTLNLMNFNARLYNPALGVFLAVDPKADVMPYNSPYVAMMNNPVYYTDPDGECPICVAIIVGAAIGAGSSAVVYTATALASGNFDWGQFGKSVAFGAVSGAIGGGIGGAFANSAFAQTAGFSLLNNTASTVAGTAILGGDITGGTIIGGIAGGLVGTGLPQFTGVKGGALSNIGAEIGYNAVRGGITGAVTGGVSAAVDRRDIGQGIAQGALY